MSLALDAAAIGGRPIGPGDGGAVRLQAPMATWSTEIRYVVRGDGTHTVADLWWADGSPTPPGTLELTTTGGDGRGGRVYWVCPGRWGRPACGRRVGRLYWPLLAPGVLACRRCHDLAYRSQNPPPSLERLRQRVLAWPAPGQAPRSRVRARASR